MLYRVLWCAICPEQRNLGALTEKSANNILDWHERDRRGEIKYIQDGVDELGLPKMRVKYKKDNLPVNRVAGAAILFERLDRSDKRIEGGCGSLITITEQQKKSFSWLHYVRNEFTHFSPKGWTIELSGIEDIISDILNILLLIVDDYWPFRHMPNEDKNTLHSKIKEINLLVSRD